MQKPGNKACTLQLVACCNCPGLLCHARCKRRTWKRLDGLVCQRMRLQFVPQVDGSFLHGTAYLRNPLAHHCAGFSSAFALLTMPSRASGELAGRCNAHRRSPALCKRLCTSAGDEHCSRHLAAHLDLIRSRSLVLSLCFCDRR